MDEIKFDGNKLFKIRKEKKLSQEKLALAIGVTRQTIYLWESNQSLPDVEKVSKICRVLEIDLSDLVDGVSSKVNSEDSDTTKSKNTKSRKFLFRIITILLILIIAIYIITTIIKFVRLNKILDKWKELDEVDSYYIKINEYLINKNNNDNISDNNFYEKYYKDGILKIVVRDNKNEEVNSIAIYDYNIREAYIIDEKEKTYIREKIDESEKILRITDDFQLTLDIKHPFILCLNPNFSISNESKENYVLRLNDNLQECIEKETGFVEYSETLDNGLRRTRKHYEIELNTDKDYEINLEDYTEIE